jgi:DNA-binding NarL/FixJ family response regulator
MVSEGASELNPARFSNREAPPTLRLVLAGRDPIFLLGLQSGLANSTGIEILGTATTNPDLWQLLQAEALDRNEAAFPDLLVLDLDRRTPDEILTLSQQLKYRFPTLPLLTLISRLDANTLNTLRRMRVEGCWPKGISLEQLMTVMHTLAGGGLLWSPQVLAEPTAPLTMNQGPWKNWQIKRRQDSLRYIQGRQEELNRTLEQANLSWWEWLVLDGQLRELQAAQYVIDQLFPATAESLEATPPSRSSPSVALNLATAHPTTSTLAVDRDFRTLKSVVIDQVTAGLVLNLYNQTGTPLEIDILSLAKRQELLLTVLRCFEAMLDDLRFSNVARSQLQPQQLLSDLWQTTLNDFLGKYRTVSLSETDMLQLVPQLLQDKTLVEVAILDQIPLFTEIVEHLLFHTPLIIDQRTYPAGSSESIQQTSYVLANTMIQVANAVVQPLLNRFSDVDGVRRDFFDRRWLSTREIERFRNSLSWQYRIQQWFGEPKDMFESQFRLRIFSETGIKYYSVYAPRDRELQDLSGIRYATTLVLEARDALAPPLQATVTFLGRGVIYLLTQIIGRGIGLVGRGVLQGIGYVRSEVRSRPTESIDRK